MAQVIKWSEMTVKILLMLVGEVSQTIDVCAGSRLWLLL